MFKAYETFVWCLKDHFYAIYGRLKKKEEKEKKKAKKNKKKMNNVNYTNSLVNATFGSGKKSC